jgi:hypothetical protein
LDLVVVHLLLLDLQPLQQIGDLQEVLVVVDLVVVVPEPF